MNMTPCFISEMPGEKTKALLWQRLADLIDRPSENIECPR